MLKYTVFFAVTNYNELKAELPLVQVGMISCFFKFVRVKGDMQTCLLTFSRISFHVCIRAVRVSQKEVQAFWSGTVSAGIV